MNDTSPRCAGPGTSCRLLQLETPGARPVWAVLDAAGMRRFTGEITLASWPVVRAYFNDGEVYYAEREGDPSIGDRLIEYGVVTPDELAAGTVQLGKVAHLGRLFDRVPTLERDTVELVLEVVTGEVLGEIADHTVERISIASYKHHPSGVSKWRRRAGSADDAPLTGEVAVVPPAPAPASLAASLATPLAPPVPMAPPTAVTQEQAIVDHADAEPTEEDHQLVADYEQMMAAANDTIVVDQPTEQPLDTIEPTVDIEPVATFETSFEANVETSFEANVETFFETGVEAPAAESSVEDSAPFVFAFDLNKVLAQVVLENDGIPLPTGDDDIADDVRAAVREALAEIEAATRPPVSDGLSATAFEVALDLAPESAADIEPAGGRAPFLPGRALGTPSGSVPETEQEEATVGAAPASDTPGTGLRRLIGGSRKP